MEDKENSYKAGVSGTVKVRDASQPLKAEVSFNRFTPTENGELGAEVSEIIFLHGESSHNIDTGLSCHKLKGCNNTKCSIL